MTSIRWLRERPQLRSPMMVVAFAGWNDAGDSATSAVGHLIDEFRSEPFADIDAEPFYDFSTTRPLVRLAGDGRRVIDWPSNQFSTVEIPGAERDVIVLSGIEPQLKWKTFAAEVTSVAADLGVELIVSLGALIADVVHSRPITVYGTSHDPKLCRELDLEPSSYEGPTGIVGVAHQAFQEANIASMSLWAAIPSYVPHAPSPKAALALVTRLGEMLRVDLNTDDLAEEADDYVSQISALVEDDDDMRAYVAQLEDQYDRSMKPESTAELIEELEEFLKDQ